MILPKTIQKNLKEELPPICWRLLSTILDCAKTSSADPTITIADKDKVLAQLGQDEGSPPAADALRKRIQRINRQIRELGIDQGTEPVLALKSTKKAFQITWSKQLLEEQHKKEQDEELKDRAAQDALDAGQRAIGSAIAPEFQKPSIAPECRKPCYQIFISHAWENDNIEKILDAFVADLERACTSLPEEWRNQFRLKIWFDHKKMHGRSPSIADQVRPACEQSSFALLLSSEKWCQSVPCQQEAAVFLSRATQNKSRATDETPYLFIQLIGDRENLDEKFQGAPAYPELTDPKYKNLVQLWEKTGEDEKRKFVEVIRQNICDYLVAHPGTDTEPPKPEPIQAEKPSLDDSFTKNLSPDISADEATTIAMIRARGDDGRQPTEPENLPAVETLYQWANGQNEGQARRVVILGGFGTGKTTTVQLLAERLIRQGKADNRLPVPIYLDFRNLLPKAEPGKRLSIELGQLILDSAGAELRGKAKPEQILGLIRSHNCVVILDGLDEIGNRIGQDNAVFLYRDFLNIIPAEVQAAEADSGKTDFEACPTRLLLTCRSHFFRDLHQQQSTLANSYRYRSLIATDSQGRRNGYICYYMAPLSLDKIKELFQKGLGEEKGASTFSLISRIHDLPGLASRPIMARFITEAADELIDRHQSSQPINIATVYESLFTLGLERDAEKQPLLTRPDRGKILTALAAHLQTQGLQSLHADELEDWFDSFASNNAGLRLLSSSGSNTRNLLHTELENASFLVRDGDDRFRFAHTSYFEYFLALAIDQAIEQATDWAIDKTNEPSTAEPPHLLALSEHPISRETHNFLFAIAESQGRLPDLQSKLARLLRSQADAAIRRLCLDLWRAGHPDGDLPEAANLTGLDLRGWTIPARQSGEQTDDQAGKPITWSRIDFSEAMLNRLDVRQICFRACRFDGTRLANAYLEACRFEDCIGIPSGLASTRGSNTELPTEWPMQEHYWRTPAIGSRPNFIPAELFSAVAVSPDGYSLLTGSDEGTVRLWDADTGEEYLCLTGHQDSVSSVAFSPDGRSLLTGSHDQTARLWDADSGEQRLCLTHQSIVNSVAVSPDSRSLLTGSDDQTARLWDLDSGEEKLCLEHQADIRSVAVSPDGHRVLTGCWDGSARLWDLDSGEEDLCLRGHQDTVNSVAFSPDNRSLLTGSDDGSARLWDVDSGEERLCLTGHQNSVRSVAFSPDGRRLLTGSWDGTARLWDADNGEERRCLTYIGIVSSVAFSPDSRRVLTGSRNGSVRLWDADSGEEKLCLKGHQAYIRSVAISPDGRSVLTGNEDNTARLWDVDSGEERLCLTGHQGSVYSVAFSPDGRQLLTGSDDKTARLWDLDSGEQRLSLEHQAPVLNAAFSPDGRRVLTGGNDKTARLWDLDSGEERLCLNGHQNNIRSVAFSPDGRRVLTGSDDGTARLWDADSGEERLCLSGHQRGVSSVAFSPDGHRILTGSWDNTARLWDADSGEERRCLTGHQGAVWDVAFSPDGCRLLTGSWDKTARLWDADSGEERCCLEHQETVNSVAFSPDSRSLLTDSDDGSVRLWDLDSGELLWIHYSFADAWARLDADSRLLKGAGQLWRYSN